MAQKKLQRFAEIRTFQNVLEYPQNMQGKWSGFFQNNNPLVLELACGKGEYAVGLGRMYPQKNFIGIDIKGNRIWVGAKTALDKGLKNVAFIRSQIDKLKDYFAKGEVSEIWITFPDPQLRLSKAKKRLTHPAFLRLYKDILQQNGCIHLKTDSPDLYDFTKTIIDLYGLSVQEDIEDVYSCENVSPELSIKTHYEMLDIAKSNKVHYLKFLVDQELNVAKDAELRAIIERKQTEQEIISNH